MRTALSMVTDRGGVLGAVEGRGAVVEVVSGGVKERWRRMGRWEVCRGKMAGYGREVCGAAGEAEGSQ